MFFKFYKIIINQLNQLTNIKRQGQDLNLDVLADSSSLKVNSRLPH